VSVRRNPGLDQLYLFDTVHNWLPNPNLKPELGSTWTAGIDLRFTPTITAQFTYFGNTLEDRISVVAGRWENIGLVNTNGYEAAVRWQITPQFSALANYTYTDARIETGADKGLQLSTVPFSVGQVGVGYQNSGWQVNVYASYNSGSRRALFTDTGVSSREFSPSWLNLDFTARVPITNNLAFLLYLENLANVRYEKVNRIYQPGLTIRVGLNANF
jgi:vitamin B12 transporter